MLIVIVLRDTLPEWSKGVDSSSTSASCVASNPTAVRLLSLEIRYSSRATPMKQGKLKGLPRHRLTKEGSECNWPLSGHAIWTAPTRAKAKELAGEIKKSWQQPRAFPGGLCPSPSFAQKMSIYWIPFEDHPPKLERHRED